MTKKRFLKDPVSGISHLIGSILALAGTYFLVKKVVRHQDMIDIMACVVFGISMVALYSASAWYHLLILTDKVTAVMRKIDHSMIYILIAGTYTPIALISLRGKMPTWGWGVFGIIWGLAFIGVGGIFFNSIMKLSRKASTILYLAMGWTALVIIFPLSRVFSFGAFAWLLGGGLFYSAGAIMYAKKKPNLFSGFGFHETFHMFIIFGTLCHFWLIYKYVL